MRDILRKPKIVVPVAAVLLAGTLGAGYVAKRAVDKQEACDRVTAMAAELAPARTAAAQGDAGLIAVLGDSYTQGVSADVAMRGFPYIAGKALGVPVLAEGVGASGYVAEGPCGNAAFGRRLAGVLVAKPDVLVIEGGLNDQGRPGQKEAVEDLFTRIDHSTTHPRVVVMSPQTPPGADLDKVSETAAIVRDAAAAHGFDYFDYGWDLEVLPDKMHPTESGHIKLGQDLAAYLKDHGVAK